MLKTITGQDLVKDEFSIPVPKNVRVKQLNILTDDKAYISVVPAPQDLAEQVMDRLLQKGPFTYASFRVDGGATLQIDLSHYNFENSVITIQRNEPEAKTAAITWTLVYDE